MQKYKFIPYNPKLVEPARGFRKSGTLAERKFWYETLKDKRLVKYKFSRQKPLGGFVVDFYCAKLKLVIELDGAVHKFSGARDKERDNVLNEKFGLRIIRYQNSEVLDNPERIVLDLLKKLSP